MRYSEIIGDAFYRIKLTSSQYAEVDAHFVASAHHYHRAQQTDDLALSRFHQDLMLRHLDALKTAVSEGDFSEAVDLTGRGLEEPQGWHKQRKKMPDEEMFSAMWPDRRYPLGDHHPYDALFQDHMPLMSIHLDSATA